MKEITIECNGKRSAALQISEMQHSVQFCSFFCSDRHFSNGGSFYSQCPEMCAQKIEYNSVNPYEREIWFSSLHFHQAMAQCEGVRARSAIYCTDSNRVHLTKISNQRKRQQTKHNNHYKRRQEIVLFLVAFYWPPSTQICAVIRLYAYEMTKIQSNCAKRKTNPKFESR